MKSKKIGLGKPMPTSELTNENTGSERIAEDIIMVHIEINNF
jgi:hypothetical protein